MSTTISYFIHSRQSWPAKRSISAETISNKVLKLKSSYFWNLLHTHTHTHTHMYSEKMFPAGLCTVKKITLFVIGVNLVYTDNKKAIYLYITVFCLGSTDMGFSKAETDAEI